MNKLHLIVFCYMCRSITDDIDHTASDDETIESDDKSMTLNDESSNRSINRCACFTCRGGTCCCSNFLSESSYDD